MQIAEQMNLGNQYRIAHHIAREPRGKHEGKAVVVAMPDSEISSVLSKFSTGMPAAVSVQAAGLATLRAFSHQFGEDYQDKAVAVVEAGSQSLFFAVLYRGEILLLRTFEVGADLLINDVQQCLKLDRDKARRILNDNSFDISQSVHTVMQPFFNQLNISRDYIERQEGVPVSDLFISGGLALSPFVLEAAEQATGMVTKRWNPFLGINMASDALPEALHGQEARFASAVGVGLGVFGLS